MARAASGVVGGGSWSGLWAIFIEDGGHVDLVDVGLEAVLAELPGEGERREEDLLSTARLYSRIV